MKKNAYSLRSGLIATIVLCWLLPIVIVVTVAGVLLDNSYRNAAQQEIQSDAENALALVELAVKDTIAASKDVSYDGVVRSAYRKYQDSGDSAELYRQVNDYLGQSFSRDSKYKAVFISFRDDPMNVEPYLISSGTTGFELVRTYHNHVLSLRQQLDQVGTGIRFAIMDGTLYVARNLMDGHFHPYASVVMMCDPLAMFMPISAVSKLSDMQMTLDDHTFVMNEAGTLELQEPRPTDDDMCFATEIEGHTISFRGVPEPFNIWTQTPALKNSVILVSLLVIPLLSFVVFLFYRNVTRPVETLAEAHQMVKGGRRGYQIQEAAPNSEFQKLYENFNAMSTELKAQFERSYLEQQATQQARIKALQSQINPHFLNNTLEVINWEARLAGDDRVSVMIEALSTMLDAALDRDGRTQIPLREELGYIDAYLYIIRQRLGEGLKVERDIDDNMLDQMIPRLILQPLAENAVEHDLTDRRGGRLALHVYRDGGDVILDMEHDGTMTEADREKVQKLLSDTSSKRIRGGSVGIRNVNQRLKLLYGSAGGLTIEQPVPGTIRARVRFPADAKIG